jgi:hypothetical protein
VTILVTFLELIEDDINPTLVFRIPAKYTLSKNAPPQISFSLQASIAALTGSVNSFSFSIIGANVALNILLSCSLSYLWSMLNSISFLSVVGLVAVSVPGRASSMIKIFFQFAQLDVLPMD